MSFEVLLNIINEEYLPETILNDLVSETSFSSGDHLFCISRLFYADPDNISFDRYSPWSGKSVLYDKRITTKITKRQLGMQDNVFYEDEDGEYQIKVSKDIHPRIPGFRRELFYVMDANNNIISDIFVIYSAENELTTTLNDGLKLLPSVRKVVRKMLENRTTSESKKALLSEGIGLTTKQINSIGRSVESYVRGRSGPKRATTITKLTDRYLLKPNDDEDFLKPEYEKIDEKIILRQIVGFNDSFHHFVNFLPFKDDQVHYHKNLELFEELTEKEARIEYGTYLDNISVSGTVPLHGTSLLIDTTFDICSDMYVTIALGVAEQFRSSRSKKNSSIILAYMLHSTKSGENHEMFSRYINDKIHGLNHDKVVPCLITDGEAAFAHYNTGVVLKESVYLRCDVHVLENMKQQIFNKKRYEEVKKLLYGFKIKTPTGFKLKAGVLDALNRRQFEKNFKEMLPKIEEEVKLRRWLENNKNMLFNQCSLIKKLYGGWATQFLTTNLVESRNNFIKKYIPNAVPGEMVVDALYSLHREEIKNRIDAACGITSELYTEFATTRENWLRMSREEKRRHLSGFGLNQIFIEDKFNFIPDWIWKNDGTLSNELFAKKLEDFALHESKTEDFFFVLNQKKCSSIACLEKVGCKLKCHDEICKSSINYSFFFCIHGTAVLAYMKDSDMRQSFIDFMKARRNKRTVKHLQSKLLQPTDGSKFPRRHGLQCSKNNETRRLDRLSGITSSSIEQTFLSDSRDSSFLEEDDNNNIEYPIDYDEHDYSFN